jgi:hypothetical protein
MRNHFFFLALFSFAVLFVPPLIGESVKILKLKMQSPESVAAVLRQAFGRRLRVAEAPMVNGVVVSSDIEELVKEAEELVKSLDQLPATLRYSVKLVGEEDRDSLIVGTRGRCDRNVLRGGIDIQKIRSRTTGGETRTIVGMEGEPVSLTTEMVRIDTFVSPWGSQDVERKQERGVKISGRLLPGEKEVMVDVFYAEGGFDQSRKLIAQVRAPLGEWFSLGSLGNAAAGSSGDFEVIDKKGGIHRNTTSAKLDRNYLLKIEKIR